MDTERRLPISDILDRTDLAALLDELAQPATNDLHAQRWHCPIPGHDDHHRAEFARTAIETRIRSRDVLEFVLPVLLDTAGQTDLTEAAKLLDVTEPITSTHSSYKDWASPFKAWALESSANLQRAMLAVAYSHAVTAGTWREHATAALERWLDNLGYQPPAP